MDPKLLRMYSDLLGEAGPYKGPGSYDSTPAPNPQAGTAAAVRRGQGAKPSEPFNFRDPFGLGAKSRQQQQNVAGSKIGAGYAAAAAGADKLASQQFPVKTAPSQSAMPKTTKTKTAAPAIDPRVAAARKVDAKQQAAAPAPGTTQDPSGGQGNAAFLPGAAGGSKLPDAMAGADATASQTQTSSMTGQDVRTAGARDATAAPPTLGYAGAGKTTTDASPTGIFSKTGDLAGGSASAREVPQQAAMPSASYGGGYDPTKTQFAYSGGQAAMPSSQGPAVTSGSGAPITTGSGGTLRSRSADEIAKAKPGMSGFFEEESESEVDESLEQQLEEAFNDMLRLSGLEKKNLEESSLLSEKAVSRQQQKFMGMVHAMQKGEKVKGASPELKKVAKTMGKKDAKDFAATKHKGLPKKVNEGLNVMLDEEGHTLEHIVNRFKHEAKVFLNTGEMSDKLYDALYDYYVDRGEMPYGIAKAREGDPYTWVAARFEADIDGTVDVKVPMGEIAGDDTLNELARLAGLSESRVDECGDMGMSSEDRLNVSTNMSSDGTKSVNISAQGDKAEELLSMLKLAGMGSSDRPSMVMIDRDEEMMEADRETEYANTPEEEYETVDRIIRQGNDLNREKKQFANMPKAGDNPMATDYMLDEELSALLDSIYVKEADPRRPKGDTGIADIYTADKGIPPPSPDEGPVGKVAAPKTPAAPKAPVIASGMKR